MAWFFERFVYNERLQLGHEEYVRPLAMGTNWNNIRIGVRFCINDSARNTIVGTLAGAALYLGVRQGSTGPSFFSDGLTDWIGAGHIGSALPPTHGNMNFNPGTPNYFGSASRPNAVWKTGASTTFATESSVGPQWVGSGQPGAYGAGFMSQLHVDIIKGSPYTLNTYYCTNAAQVQVNITDAAFLTALEVQSTPANMSQAVGKTIAYTGAGLFDTLSIVAWRSWPHIEIDMIGVARFS